MKKILGVAWVVLLVVFFSVTNSRVSAATVIAINSGGGAVAPFSADQYFNGGNTYATSNAINISGVMNAAPMAVYQTERWQSSFSYTIPGLTQSAPYTVRLHFAEIYFSASGKRTFNVDINNARTLSAFDIIVAAGGANRAVVREFTTTANASGQIVIAFSSVVDNAKINGIEIISADSTTITPASPTMTVTSTRTPTVAISPTATATRTQAPTNTPTATSSPTATRTNTPTPAPTSTPTRTATPTNTLTSTSTPTPTWTPTLPPTPTAFASFYFVLPSKNTYVQLPFLTVRILNGNSLGLDNQSVLVEECADTSDPCLAYANATTLTTYTRDGLSGMAFHLVDQSYWLRVTWNGIQKTVRFAPNVFYQYVEF